MFSQDLHDFIRSLDDHDVRYLVVGGYAVAFHGEPRYTKLVMPQGLKVSWMA
jgi:hypothetical protein